MGWFQSGDHSSEDKKVHTFPKGISLKVNVIERVEFELAFNNFTVQQVSYNSTWTSSNNYAILGTFLKNTNNELYSFTESLERIWKVPTVFEFF